MHNMSPAFRVFLSIRIVFFSQVPPRNNPSSLSCQRPTFCLKWLPGTSVSRCYGCSQAIINPPLPGADDIVVVFRDIREFHDRLTGQRRLTGTPQNVHFHLRASCLRARYPLFNKSMLHIPQELFAFLRSEHYQRLMDEFEWLF